MTQAERAVVRNYRPAQVVKLCGDFDKSGEFGDERIRRDCDDMKFYQSVAAIGDRKTITWCHRYFL